MNVRDYISDLDTIRFGFIVAKVNDFGHSPEELIVRLKEVDVKLVISKVDSGNIKLINTLENLNFFTKDIQVTQKFDLINYVHNAVSFNSDFKVRDFKESDVLELKRIALSSFKNYGHYFEDKKLDTNKCNEIYGDWIVRSCEVRGVADKILVAECDGNIAGFLSFKIHSNNANRYAVGGIGAITDEYRNRNVFRTIVVEGLNWGKDLKLDWEEHNALITNYPVNRSLSKLGFKTYKSFVTMHHWI